MVDVSSGSKIKTLSSFDSKILNLQICNLKKSPRGVMNFPFLILKELQQPRST